MAINTLTAIKVENLTEAGRYADGGGLYLDIAKNGTKSWLYRYQLNGKRRWMGLGAYHKKANSLAMARENALDAKKLVSKGIDPIEHYRDEEQQKVTAQREAERESLLKEKTFQHCAEEYIKSMKAQWSNAKHAQQWTNTLKTYAYPVIGDMPMRDIEVRHIRQCLDPIWETKTETATRVRQRIEAVIYYAIANEYRESSNPAIWKGLLDKFYPKPEKVKQIRYEQAGRDKHHAALPYEEMPEFMSKLKMSKGIAAAALRFAILTASRTSEVRFARWDEFNLKKKEWNIPRARMKARKEHRVALSDAAVELLESLPRENEYVFPGVKENMPISDGAMTQVLKRMGRNDITVHGFRSSFRDYIGEETGYPYRLAEFALAHGLTDEAEKAYARGDMLKKRFAMMNDWANFVDGKR